jgi:hypothetical protein
MCEWELASSAWDEILCFRVDKWVVLDGEFQFAEEGEWEWVDEILRVW